MPVWPSDCFFLQNIVNSLPLFSVHCTCVVFKTPNFVYTLLNLRSMIIFPWIIKNTTNELFFLNYTLSRLFPFYNLCWTLVYLMNCTFRLIFMEPDQIFRTSHWTRSWSWTTWWRNCSYWRQDFSPSFSRRAWRVSRRKIRPPWASGTS